MATVAPETTIQDVLARLRAEPLWRNVAHEQRIPPRPARYAPFPEALHPEVVDVLRRRGIEQLYTHQAEAIETVLGGENAVVVTPTASGKTLCYNLPVVQRLVHNPESRALYIFPTKALSHDQYKGVYDLTHAMGRDIKVYTYDGDTPGSARRAIREAAHIVVTNPDMLHSGILPHHTKWIKLFENLETIVIDEMHQYRGVFGSHMANVVRRLRRICKFYGANPRFVCCSATIANPKEMAEQIVEEPFRLIDQSGAPTGERVFLFYNPPVVNSELGIRASSVKEANKLAAYFIERGLQTIIFARSRTRVEIIGKYLRRAMGRRGNDAASKIRAYRSGLLPNERRAIENGIKSGEILGVVSTNALELGIDIGSLQCSILTGYPGSIASAWQQAGRAGRQQQTSVTVLVGQSSPLDQYLMSHAEYFFGSSPENGVLNPDNAAIMASHLRCALNEIPMADDEVYGPAHPGSFLKHFEDVGIARHSGGRTHWSSDAYPAEDVSLRTATPQNFIVHNNSDKNRVLAEVDYDSARFLIHDQAIYIHQGRTFYVDQLDWDRRRCYVHEVEADYYTEAISKSDLKVLTVDKFTAAEGNDAVETFSRNPDETAPSVADYPESVPADAEDFSPNDVNRPAPLPAGAGERAHAVNAAPRDASPLDELDFCTEAPVPEPSPEDAAVLSRPLLERCFGDVKVSTTVPKFKKIKFETHESIGYGDILLPQADLQTQATWWVFRPELEAALAARRLNLASGLKGLAYLIHKIVPLWVMCDPMDIATHAEVRSPSTGGRPTIYLYDRYPGGIGLALRAYGMDRQVLRAALELSGGCACAAGCPSCVGPALDSGETAKSAARLLLEGMMQ